MKLRINNGTYVILNAKSGRLDTSNYYSILEALNSYKEPYEVSNPDKIPGMDPVEDCRPLHSIFIPREGSIDSLSVINALKYNLSLHPNVTFTNDFVSNLNIQDYKIQSILLASCNSISAKEVIITNGSLLKQVPEVNRNTPLMLAGVGYAIIAEQHSMAPIKHVIRTPNRAGACGLHVLPRNNYTIYIGATNNVYLEPQNSVSIGLMHFLLECAMAQVNQNIYQQRLVTYKVGNRPASIDTFPLN